MMNDIFSNRPRKQIFSRPRHNESEEFVHNNLAVSPSDMIEMVNRGEPITPANLGLVYDEGYSHLDFEPPTQYRRGIDIADCWEAEQRSKTRLRDAQSKGLLTPSSAE